MDRHAEDALTDAIVSAYQRIGVPTDQLPYSEDFENLYRSVLNAVGDSFPRALCWRLLARARKRGRLPRLFR